MMFHSASLCIVVLLAIGAQAHLCLLSPTQRGGIPASINSWGNSACDIQEGPCGSSNSSEPGIQIRPSVPFTFVFQKNLNHYYAQLAKNVQQPSESDFKTLATIPDTNATDGALYTYRTRLPITYAETHAVIRVVYNTANPNAPAHFYQCADIAIL